MSTWLFVIALAQDRSWEVDAEPTSPFASLHFGAALSRAGDVDGDGVPDVLVGAPGDGIKGSGSAGSVSLLSGASGARLLRHVAASGGTSFGASVAAGSDLDGDGVGDFLVGAPDEGAGRGRVQILSGATGASLATLSEPAVYRFGVRVAFLGDHDGDGVDDFGVCGRDRSSALGRGLARYDPTTVTLLSGASFTVLRTLRSATPWVDADASVCRLGDLNGDGVAEIAAGFPGGRKGPRPHGGYVVLLDGSQLTKIATLVGETWSGAFGTAIGRLGDLDRDGIDDFAVSEPDHGSAGRIQVFSGRAPHPRLFEWIGAIGDHLGALPAEGRFDFDADGFADVLVGNGLAGRLGSAATTAIVYSGRSGRLLYGFRSVDFSSNLFGRGAVFMPAGDLDGDSLDDVILAAPDDAPGFAAAHLGNRAFLQANQETYRAGETLRLAARGRPGHFLAIAIVDISGVKTYITVARGWLDSLGEWSAEVPVPPGLSGQTMTAIAKVWRIGVPTAISRPEKVIFQ